MLIRQLIILDAILPERVRKVVVEYPQDWLSTKLEDSDQKQTTWRLDPKKSGAAGCIGDIGAHTEYISGLQIKKASRGFKYIRRWTIVGRLLDDDGNVLLRFENGAKGILHASQISVGEENNLSIRIYGETGDLEWHQKEPNSLLVKHLDKLTEIYRAGSDYLCEAAQAASHTPAGHQEAFSTIYNNFTNHIRAFIEAVVNSSNENATW